MNFGECTSKDPRRAASGARGGQKRTDRDRNGDERTASDELGWISDSSGPYRGNSGQIRTRRDEKTDKEQKLSLGFACIGT
jgi:hypothetical protein